MALTSSLNLNVIEHIGLVIVLQSISENFILQRTKGYPSDRSGQCKFYHRLHLNGLDSSYA